MTEDDDYFLILLQSWHAKNMNLSREDKKFRVKLKQNTEDESVKTIRAINASITASRR